MSYSYMHFTIKGKARYQLRFNVKLHAPYSFALQPPRPWVTPVLQTKHSLYVIYQNHFLKIEKSHNVLKYIAHTLTFFFSHYLVANCCCYPSKD